MHWLDRVVAGTRTRNKQFSGGWGDLDFLEHLFQAGFPEHPVPIEVSLSPLRRRPKGLSVRRGRFRSPAASGLPIEARDAVFEWWTPTGAVAPPLCIFIAATGEQGFIRRRRLSRPLMAKGMSVLFLENPYYGVRRPAGQLGTRLRTVVDQFSSLKQKKKKQSKTDDDCARNSLSLSF